MDCIASLWAKSQQWSLNAERAAYVGRTGVAGVGHGFHSRQPKTGGTLTTHDGTVYIAFDGFSGNPGILVLVIQKLVERVWVDRSSVSTGVSDHQPLLAKFNTATLKGSYR